ncbi:HAMP domain-containing protein [bacterium]|nr:HAMP domain-containing protein [bacterium]
MILVGFFVLIAIGVASISAFGVSMKFQKSLFKKIYLLLMPLCVSLASIGFVVGMLGISVLTISIGGALAVMTAVITTKGLFRAIITPIRQLQNIAEALADGDLTNRSDLASDDELGQLGSFLNQSLQQLNDLVILVKKNTDTVGASISSITAISAQMAAGAEEHNSQAAEVASSVEEMSSSIMQNSQNAGETAKIAELAGSRAKQGTEVIRLTREGMRQIVATTGKLNKIVSTLTDRSRQIDEVTKIIDKIADQTNLLALNAAVEAARAGDQGSGFAVVADEVRKLAERTAQATKEITETIVSIQNDTTEASEAMKEATATVNSGSEATERTEVLFNEILESVSQASDMIQHIAAASEEQSAGAEEISSSVVEMNTVSRQASSGAEHMAASVDELSIQAANLRSAVARFKFA